MNAAEVLFLLVRFWLVVGCSVTVIFLTIGIDRIDEDARSTYLFRPLLVPGILLIWPLVLWRWITLETGSDVPDDRFHPVRGAHKIVAVGMAFAILGIVAVGLSVRQQWPDHISPERISPERISVAPEDIQ